MIQPENEKWPRLVGISGPAKDMQVQVPAHLGRDAGNTVRLDDDAVSPAHAEVYVRDGRTIARDLHSGYGTSVNGARLPQGGERILERRDILKIGNSRLILLLPEEPPAKTFGMRDAPPVRKNIATLVGPVEDMVARADKSVGDALVAFGISINRTRNSPEMLSRTIEAIFDTV